MDRMLYIAMATAKHSQLKQSMITNNIANATTDGFKKDFMSLMAMNNNTTRQYSTITSTTPQLNQGNIRQTGNPMDITAKSGYISAIGPDGEPHYLTSASMSVDVDGQLIDSKNNLILNDLGQTIDVGEVRSISIGENGSVSIIPLNGGQTDVAIVGRIGLVDMVGTITKDKFGRLVTEGETVVSVVGKINSGSLEGSNVVMAQEMLDMIETNRQYEQSVKLMKTVQDMHAVSTKLLR
jgi:flagellar basal-body rod protein FlgF